MSLPWSEKGFKDTPVDNDEVMILDSADTDPDTINKRVRLADLPTVSGGVSNATNLGSGTEIFFQKNGTVLEFKSLFGDTNKIDLSSTDNDITFTLGADVVTIDKANTYDAGFKQSFVADATSAGLNINTFEPTSLAIGDIWRTAVNLKYQDTTNATQIVVTEDLTQTLTNKTMTASANTFSGFVIGSEVTGASTALTDSSNIARLDASNIFTVKITSPIFETSASSPSLVGVVRLAREDSIGWRNQGNSANLLLEHDANDFLTFDNGFVAVTLTQGASGEVLTSNGPSADPTFEILGISGTVNVVRDDTITVSNPSTIDFEDTLNQINFSISDDTPVATVEATISTGYIGQTSITTLGTISFGTWNATTIGVTNGGTGVTTSTGSVSVVLSDSPTLTTPTLNTPAIDFFTNANHDHLDASGGGLLTIASLGTGTIGQLIVWDLTGNPSTLDPGTAGFVLTSNGGGFVPSYQDLLSIFPVSDTIFIIEGSADPTKLLRFEIDGFTSGFTRVITPPDANIQLVNTSDGTISNTNVNATAAIDYSKLATLLTGEILIGDTGVPTVATMTGDITIDNLGVTSLRTFAKAFVTLTGFTTTGALNVLPTENSLTDISSTDAWVISQASDFSFVAGTGNDIGEISYDGTGTITALFTYFVSLSETTGSPDPIYVSLSNNVGEITNTRITIDSSTSADFENLSGSAIVSLSTSDTIKMTLSAETATTPSVDIVNASYTIIELA